MKADQPARIILIEDNPGDVGLLRRALEDAEGGAYQIEVLTDGEKALRFVREYHDEAGRPHPCVLVLDLHLPKYDGFEVLRAIRRESALSRVKVVVVTGILSGADEAAIQVLGVRLYRKKPTDLESLLKLGEEIIAICREHMLEVAV